MDGTVINLNRARRDRRPSASVVDQAPSLGPTSPVSALQVGRIPIISVNAQARELALMVEAIGYLFERGLDERVGEMVWDAASNVCGVKLWPSSEMKRGGEEEREQLCQLLDHWARQHRLQFVVADGEWWSELLGAEEEA